MEIHVYFDLLTAYEKERFFIMPNLLWHNLKFSHLKDHPIWSPYTTRNKYRGATCILSWIKMWTSVTFDIAKIVLQRPKIKKKQVSNVTIGTIGNKWWLTWLCIGIPELIRLALLRRYELGILTNVVATAVPWIMHCHSSQTIAPCTQCYKQR